MSFIVICLLSVNNSAKRLMLPLMLPSVTINFYYKLQLEICHSIILGLLPTDPKLPRDRFIMQFILHSAIVIHKTLLLHKMGT